MLWVIKFVHYRSWLRCQETIAWNLVENKSRKTMKSWKPKIWVKNKTTTACDDIYTLFRRLVIDSNLRLSRCHWFAGFVLYYRSWIVNEVSIGRKVSSDKTSYRCIQKQEIKSVKKLWICYYQKLFRCYGLSTHKHFQASFGLRV